MTQCRQAVAPPLVKGDEEHVAGGRHGATLAHGGRKGSPFASADPCEWSCRWAPDNLVPHNVVPVAPEDVAPGGRIAGVAESLDVPVDVRPDGRMAGRMAGSRAGHRAAARRGHEVRMDAPPSRVPKSISQAPRRGALTRCTARPPVTGIPAAERCIARGSRVEAAARRAACSPPAVSSRSRRWADAIDSTALPWIIASHLSERSWRSCPWFSLLCATQCTCLLTSNQEYSNIGLCLC